MSKRPLSMVCLVITVLLFLSSKLIDASPPSFGEWEGERVTVIGEVFKKEVITETEKDSQLVYLKIYSVEYGEQKVNAVNDDYRTICYLKENQILPEIGSILQVSGRMKCFAKASNPGQFDAESYYQTLKISFQLNQTEIQAKSNTYRKWEESLYEFRESLSDVFDKTLPKEDASVMKTMLLGDKRATEEERKELYQRNGIAHILAISGLHISLLGMTLFRILRKVGVPVFGCAGCSFGFVILYGFMTGFSVSVVRAVGMFGFHMLAMAIGRTYDIVTATAVMGVWMLSNQPLYFYSSSFLLSFGCVLAIGTLVPALTVKQLKTDKELPGWLCQIMSGAAISIATLPFQLWFFYQLPLYSVFLNLLVIPLMSFLLPAGILLLLFGGNSGFVQVSLAHLISGILHLYDLACHFFECLPGAHVQAGQPDMGRMSLYFCILAGIVVCQKKLSLKKKWLLVSMAVIMLLWPEQGKCTLTFLDVGQGDCIHIESKEGNHYLIDGGSSSVSGVGEYRILPYLKSVGAGELSAVFVTHPDEDHCNGIEELMVMDEKERIPIKKLYLPDVGEAAKTKGYCRLEQSALSAGIEVGYFSKGMCLKDGELEMLCLHPKKAFVSESENAYSLVFLLRYREFQALLTGDIEEEGEATLIQVLEEVANSDEAEFGRVNYSDDAEFGKMNYSDEAEFGKMNYSDDATSTKLKNINISVLKVAHHGSRYSTSDMFLELVKPKIAVISCGERNSYGHPHQETLERLKSVGSEILMTSEYGAITVEIGKKVEVYGFAGADGRTNS